MTHALLNAFRCELHFTNQKSQEMWGQFYAFPPVWAFLWILLIPAALLFQIKNYADLEWIMLKKSTSPAMRIGTASANTCRDAWFS